VLVVAALPFELGAMRGQAGSYRWGVTGVGQRAAAGLTSLIERHRPRAVVGIGFCGGLRQDAQRGTVAIPAEVVDERGGSPIAFYPHPGGWGRIGSVGRVAADPGEKARLRERSGADWVDQESYAWARVAARRGIPLTVVRVVLDGPHEFLPTWGRPESWPAALFLPARALWARRILRETGREVLCAYW
jgi:adenosylhomocysteine nucleosidase